VRDRILWVRTGSVRSGARPCLGITPSRTCSRFILLTATRRDEAADMRWAELEGDEVEAETYG